MPAASSTQTRRVIIESKVTGSQEVKAFARSLAEVNKSTSQMNRSLQGFSRGFKNIFVAGTIAMGVRSLIGMSDNMQMLSDRIKLLTKDGADVNDTMTSLKERADRARVSMDAMATIYARVAQAANKTGLSTNALLSITETLQKTFVISGSTAQEAAAASVQLSQGLASGVVRGEEFNSIMEQNALLAQILADKIAGGSVGALRAMAKEGEVVSNRVLVALAESTLDVDEKMKNLRLTVGQGLTIAFNTLQLAIAKLNEKLNISDGIGKTVVWLTQNFKYLGVIAAAVAASGIMAMVIAVSKLSVALSILTKILKGNVIILAITALVIAGMALYDNWSKVEGLLIGMGIWFAELEKRVNSFRISISEAMDSLFKTNTAATVKANLARYDKELDAKIAEYEGRRKKLEEDSKKADNKRKLEYQDTIDEVRKMFSGKTSGEMKTKEMLAELNKAYLDTRISAQEYYDSLDATRARMLHKEFREGKMDLIAYNEALRGFAQKDLNRDLKEGSMSMLQFIEASDGLAQKGLDEKLSAGTISLKEYNAEVLKLRHNTMTTADGIQAGFMAYFDSFQSYATEVSSVTQTALKGVENEFVDFVRKGEATWTKFADTVIDEILRITYQMAIARPIIQAVMGMLNPSGNSAVGVGDVGGMGQAPTTFHAQGNAFNSGGVIPFAKGGVVASPTMFNFGRNKTGVMGEKGAEAIMPLRRTSSGDLGVQATSSPVYITVNNQSGASVDTKESTGPNGERMIEMTIMNTVKKGIESGNFDNSFSRSYGINRRGN